MLQGSSFGSLFCCLAVEEELLNMPSIFITLPIPPKDSTILLNPPEEFKDPRMPFKPFEVVGGSSAVDFSSGFSWTGGCGDCGMSMEKSAVSSSAGICHDAMFDFN